MLRANPFTTVREMTGRTLMIQGTSSSVGKSLCVAALCRLFARRGLRVAPFKSQNMSNNAAVCADGSEIGRSQALQAEAANVLPVWEMNPILLKPEADARSQVIVRGRPWKTLSARDYFRVRDELWPVVTEACDALRNRFDLVIIEGAGSPAELNLHQAEIVNMAVARYCQSPVLLVGDIERGGVFAQLLGTLWLLDEADRQLVQGLIVNKFRGDPRLFDSGIDILAERGGVPVLGVIPWLADTRLPEEDGQPLELASHGETGGSLDIAVVRFPRIANFDDFDALAAEPGVNLRYVTLPRELDSAAAIILPGTKSTGADLSWLRETGLAGAILRKHAGGTHIVGICGGYQMLGQWIRDPHGVESSEPEMAGLGLLPTQTNFAPEKSTHQIRANVRSGRHCGGFEGDIAGYEIHMGQTSGTPGWLTITRRGSSVVQIEDGAVSDDGRCWGCYVHGLFANDEFRRGWLSRLRGPGDGAVVAAATVQSNRNEAALDRLADHFGAALDWQQLDKILSTPQGVLHV